MMFHERVCFVAAESDDEARQKHDDRESAFEVHAELHPDDELSEAALDDEIVEEPVEITDPSEIEYARRVIGEES